MENSTGVMFLADLPAPERVKSLDPNRSPGDEYVVKGREIYLWLAAQWHWTLEAQQRILR